jgi:hypothetical protein
MPTRVYTAEAWPAENPGVVLQRGHQIGRVDE